MPLKPISVTQLNEYISRVVGTDPLLGNVTVRGEASGVKYHSNGFIYFSLVDSMSKVNCALPRENVSLLKYEITDGMELVVTGGITVYKKNGSYSLFVRNIEVSGEGSLAIAFEQMKAKLAKEGLFDQAHKKALPSFPYKVGVVTSSTGAAVRDIIKIIKSRNEVVDVVVFPVLVQGNGAAANIAHTIDYVNEHFNDIEVLIVGRGGGAAEDLFAFNEEILARSIYDSRIPVISAVGHEIDFTISDMVADVRAETPTAAAQIAVPDTFALKDQIEDIKSQMERQLNNNVMYNSLKAYNIAKEMKEAIYTRLLQAQSSIDNLKLLISENDPRRILESGYSIIENGHGKVVTATDNINSGETYKITFSKGSAYYNIEETGSDDHEC